MTNVSELNRVMTFIKDNPEMHDQSIWANECGTTACLAGWACLLNGYSIDTEKIGDYKKNHGPNAGIVRFGGPILDSFNNAADIQYTAIDILDLDDEDANILFAEANTVDDLELMVKDLANGDDLDELWVEDSDGNFIRNGDA